MNLFTLCLYGRKVVFLPCFCLDEKVTGVIVDTEIDVENNKGVFQEEMLSCRSVGNDVHVISETRA